MCSSQRGLQGNEPQNRLEVDTSLIMTCEEREQTVVQYVLNEQTDKLTAE